MKNMPVGQKKRPHTVAVGPVLCCPVDYVPWFSCPPAPLTCYNGEDEVTGIADGVIAGFKYFFFLIAELQTGEALIRVLDVKIMLDFVSYIVWRGVLPRWVPTRFPVRLVSAMTCCMDSELGFVGVCCSVLAYSHV